MPEEIKTAITEAAQAPAAFAADDQSFQSHKLSELIKADKHLDGVASQGVVGGFGGITVKKIIAPGAI